MSTTNRQWRLAQRPSGAIDDSTFTIHEADIPPAPDGGIVVKTQYLGFDPAMRGWLEDRPSYVPPVQINEVMRASGAGEVIASANPDFPVGSTVYGLLGWQEYAVFDRSSLQAARIQRAPNGMSASQCLSVLGTASMTAYFGVLDVGQLQERETVLVSGAAGATGSVVCQIAKLKGCRVIGIASGDKCDWLREQGFVDEAIDYQKEPLKQRIRELCPQGVDLYFENVGGDILPAAIANMANHSRIVLCGMIAGYNDLEPRPGPSNLIELVKRRVHLRGFIVLDYLDREQEFIDNFGGWVRDGKIKVSEDIQEGFENIPRTLNRLFAGKNRGRQLLRLD